MAEQTTTSEREVAAFWDQVSRLMDERGIEGIEDLHQRFLETDYAEAIRVPGRHRGSKPKLPEFKRHVTGRYPVIYGELMNGLIEVLDITDESEKARLCLSYVWGRPSDGVHPTTPLP
jgi:hypothetical protein